jgi:uncharacterized protein YndB with AHSA1/START domain
MRILGIGGLVVVALIALVLIVGWSLPVTHHVTRSVSLRAPPDSVFALISHPAEFPQWRSDVTRVEPAPAEGGHGRFREVGQNGAILYQVESAVPNRRLVTRIVDRSLPFGGAWTYEIIPSAGSTTLQITEDGEVYNPLFRFVSRFITGQTSTLDRFLGDVRRRLDRPE